MKPFQLFWTITRKFYRKSCFMIFDRLKITFDRLSAIFDRLIRNWAAIEISINSEIIFLSFSIDWAKDSTDQKCYISNSHLENSRTWILTLWNNIFQTQISLLQLIHVYTYICNINLMLTFAYAAFVLFLFLFFFFFLRGLKTLFNFFLTTHQSQTHHLSVPTTNHQLSLSSNLLLVLLKTNSMSIGLWKGNSGFFRLLSVLRVWCGSNELMIS